MLSRVLSSFGFMARRSVTTTASRQLSESTGVSGDAKEWVRMIKNDGLVLPLFLAFASVFGYVHYHIYNTKKTQPREYVGLPKVREQGYKCSTFERPDIDLSDK